MKKVEIVSYLESEPKIVGTVFWSERTGVLCDSAKIRDSLSFGIAVPPKGEMLYADSGLNFLKALPFGYTGLIRAGDPIECNDGDARGAEPIPIASKGASPFNPEGLLNGTERVDAPPSVNPFAMAAREPTREKQTEML